MASCTIQMKVSLCGLSTGTPMRRRHKLPRPRKSRSLRPSTPISQDTHRFINRSCRLRDQYLHSISKDPSTILNGCARSYPNTHLPRPRTAVRPHRITTATIGLTARLPSRMHDPLGTRATSRLMPHKGLSYRHIIHHTILTDIIRQIHGLGTASIVLAVFVANTMITISTTLAMVSKPLWVDDHRLPIIEHHTDSPTPAFDFRQKVLCSKHSAMFYH